MVLGAGAGVFILEAEEIAKAQREAHVMAELAGYGTSSDAKDPVRPDVHGAAASYAQCIEDAGVSDRRDRLHQCAWHRHNGE